MRAADSDCCGCGAHHVVLLIGLADQPGHCPYPPLEQTENGAVRSSVLVVLVFLDLELAVGPQGHDRFIRKAHLQSALVANL